MAWRNQEAETNRVIAYKAGQFTDFDIDEALSILGLDEFISSISKHPEWSADDVRSNFTDYFIRHIEANADNIVGAYIFKTYRPNIPEDKCQPLLLKYPQLKEHQIQTMFL